MIMVSRKTYLMRIYRGWTPEDAANTPAMSHPERGRKGGRPFKGQGKKDKIGAREGRNAKA